MKKPAGQGARIVLNEEVINSVAAVHTSNRLAAHHASTKRVDAIRLNILDLREMDTVFVAKRKIVEKIFQGKDAAFCEEFGALWTDAFQHLDIGLKTKDHRSYVYIIPE